MRSNSHHSEARCEQLSVVRAPASRDHFFLLQPHCTVVLLRWQGHLLACGDCFFLKRLLCTTLHMPKTPAYHCTPQITPVCRNCFFLQRPLWAITIHGWQSPAHGGKLSGKAALYCLDSRTTKESTFIHKTTSLRKCYFVLLWLTGDRGPAHRGKLSGKVALIHRWQKNPALIHRWQENPPV